MTEQSNICITPTGYYSPSRPSADKNLRPILCIWELPPASQMDKPVIFAAIYASFFDRPIAAKAISLHY